MKQFVKKYSLVLLMVLVLFLFPVQAKALTYTGDKNDTHVCFNLTNGNYGGGFVGFGGTCPSGYAIEYVKVINNKHAYCVQWGLEICSKNYEVDSSWSKDSKSAIAAGMMAKEMSDLVSDGAERYEQVGAVLNTFFNKRVYGGTSYNFYNTNNRVRQVYDQAVEYESNLKLNTSIPAPQFSLLNGTLNESNGYYISDKIVMNNLYATYGGVPKYDGQVTYVLKATSTSGTAQICTRMGSNCSDSVTIEPKTDGEQYSFYVKVSGSDLKASSTVTVSVSASNTSVYPTIIRYNNTDCTNSQHLVTVDSSTISRTGGKSIRLLIPNTVNHMIVANKVDEYGNSLEGSTLELYQDYEASGKKLLADNSGGSSSITYTSPNVAENDDDFFKHDYYLVEKSAPDGYVLSGSVNHFYRMNSISNGNGNVCYYVGNDGEEPTKVDSEFCNFDNYVYKCQSSEGGNPVDLNDSGNCEFSSTNQDEDASTTVTYEKICYNISGNTKADDGYCSNKGNYTKVTTSSGNLIVTQVNNKNTIKISKKAVGGNEEVNGASLKICTASSYESQKDSCDPAKTIDGVEMSWISIDKPYEFVGVPKGDYYIIEITPPRGYIKATTATSFSIDEKGDVKSGDTVITNEEFLKGEKAIVIENDVNFITISKLDITTAKELPGATISICQTYIDENDELQMVVDQYTGDCAEAVLEGGTAASWVSTDEPKKIIGLPAGTYYLVEKIAPTNYTTAESVLFTLKDDGTLVDAFGNSLADNKLVMYDMPIIEIPTGSLSTYIVGGIFVLVIALGIGSYLYLRKTKTPVGEDSKKVRKRKIHK